MNKTSGISQIAGNAWKYLNKPVEGKFLEGTVKAFGGNATKSALTAEMKLKASRDAAKALLKEKLKNGEITADIYRHQVHQSAIKHGVPKGNFLQRQLAYTAEDISHPIANTKKSLMDHVLKYDPESGKMIGKSPLGIAGATALSGGMSAWMISDVLKDKQLNNTSKAGKSLAYAAMPLTMRKIVPSIVGYTAADKVFKATKPEYAPSNMVRSVKEYGRTPGITQ